MARLPRREFIKASGIGLMPAFIPFSVISGPKDSIELPRATNNKIVRFTSDGEIFEPADYLAELQKAHHTSPIERDKYGNGGAVELLEKAFAEITGKERAIYMPTGTMANELAIAVLSGDKTKVFVQDTSHVYRDEGDAAQSVFGKRLIALAKDKTYFTTEELKTAYANLKLEEYIPGEVGAVSIENPNRRMNGTIVPLEEIKQISSFCQSQNIGLHLDGARIFMASAWTGVSVKTYASYFDTIYISLYKYLGASGGAVLCGPANVINKMPRLIKVHGGSIAGNWLNAAMALHRLKGFEARLQNAIKVSEGIFSVLNKTEKIKISPLQGGTNIYSLELTKEINGSNLRERLSNEFNIRIGPADDKNCFFIYVNETLLNQTPDDIISAFRKCT
jgi:threonine aldolase